MPGNPITLQFDITGADLATALRIPFETNVFGHKQVRAWSKDGERLILHWLENHDATPLPAPLGFDAAVAFIESWLETADYGPEPDTDGGTEKSCRVYNEQWSRIGNNHYAFVAIEPAWMVYGK